jgi:hypothetical protein
METSARPAQRASHSRANYSLDKEWVDDVNRRAVKRQGQHGAPFPARKASQYSHTRHSTRCSAHLVLLITPRHLVLPPTARAGTAVTADMASVVMLVRCVEGLRPRAVQM